MLALLSINNSMQHHVSAAMLKHATHATAMQAVQVGSPEIVASLLKAGADINSRDSKGRTCLHWLSSFNTAVHIQIAGTSALQHACMHCRQQLFKMPNRSCIAKETDQKLLTVRLRSHAARCCATSAFVCIYLRNVGRCYCWLF